MADAATARIIIRWRAAGSRSLKVAEIVKGTVPFTRWFRHLVAISAYKGDSPLFYSVVQLRGRFCELARDSNVLRDRRYDRPNACQRPMRAGDAARRGGRRGHEPSRADATLRPRRS